MSAAEGSNVPEAAAAAPVAAAPGGVAARPQSPGRITQSNALSLYCLTKGDLAALPFRAQANPHKRCGAAMRLYVQTDVQALALRKYGGAAGLAKKRERNAGMAAKAAATRAHNDGWRVGANPQVWTVEVHGQFTPQFRAAVREFLLCAHRKRLFGGADSFVELTQRCIKFMVEVVPPRANQLAKKERKARERRYYTYDMDDMDDSDWERYEAVAGEHGGDFF